MFFLGLDMLPHNDLSLVIVGTAKKSAALVCTQGRGAGDRIMDTLISYDSCFDNGSEALEVFEDHAVIPSFRNLAHK